MPLILFFIYELYRFISILVTERAKKTAAPAVDEEEIKRRAIEEYLAAQKASEAATDAPEATAEETAEEKEEIKEENNYENADK